MAYPALLLLERQPFFERSFAHRKGDLGDFRPQMVQVQVQLTFALLLAGTWGLLGSEHRYVPAAAVMAWAFGAAAAALFGKTFGKNKIRHELVDEGKTHEGSWAMYAFVFAALFLTLVLYGGVPWWAPFATFAALLIGRSATQTAAFVRRTVEFAAVLVSWLAFRRVQRTFDAQRRKIERLVRVVVGAALALSAVACSSWPARRS